MTDDTNTETAAAKALATGDLMRDAMSKLDTAIRVLMIAYKTGCTTDHTLDDFKRAAITHFRNEVIAITHTSLSSLLKPDEMSEMNRLMMAAVLDESRDQLNKSRAPAKSLFEHIRAEHKRELLQWAFERSGRRHDADWED